MNPYHEYDPEVWFDFKCIKAALKRRDLRSAWGNLTGIYGHTRRDGAEHWQYRVLYHHPQHGPIAGYGWDMGKAYKSCFEQIKDAEEKS